MLRLTLLLCVSMFLVLLIGGRDFGQTRPGLAAAARETADAPVEIAVAQALAEAPPATTPEPAVTEAPVVEAAFTPETDAIASRLSLPLIVSPAPDAAIAEAPVEPALPAVPAGPVFTVSAEAVNVREGPSTRDPVLDRLMQGEAVTVLWADDTGWARIRIEGDGVEGFVFADYLIPADPAN